MVDFEQWEGFEGSLWKEEVNVRDFIQKNYTPYTGDQSFLAGPTKRTERLMEDVNAMLKLEQDYFKRKNVLRAAYLIWKLKLFQVSLLTAPATSAKLTRTLKRL